jgi:hypothetical protein
MNDIEFKKIYLSLPIAACVIDRTLCFVAANSMYADLMRAAGKHTRPLYDWL